MAEQITTAEELDALPVGSVVVEGDHTTPDAFLGLTRVSTIPGVFHRFPDGWYVVAGYGARDVPLPARVLYRPDAALAAHDRQVAERAWDEGFDTARRWNAAPMCRNPYRAAALAPRPAAPGVSVSAEQVERTFTERQAAAWPEAVALINRYGVGAPEDPCAYGWTLNWHDETRPGRGHYLDAQFNDGERFAQITMDVYGSPMVSVASLDWLHSDSDEDCDCEPCQAYREAEAALEVTP